MQIRLRLGHFREKWIIARAAGHGKILILDRGFRSTHLTYGVNREGFSAKTAYADVGPKGSSVKRIMVLGTHLHSERY